MLAWCVHRHSSSCAWYVWVADCPWPCNCLLQAKTHEKVDSLGEERSIGCHAVVMLIRKDLA